MNAARAGDGNAVSQLLRAVWEPAYRIARAMLDNPVEAEDAAQEACAIALRSLHTLRDTTRFVPWFYRIVVNEAKRNLRTRSREIAIDDDATGDRFEKRLALDDRLDVRHAIDALPAADRVVIVLRYYFGMRSAEIATITNTSAVTVRWRVMKAHRLLRVALESSDRSRLSLVEEPSR